MKLKFPDEASAPSDPLPEYGSPPVVETSIGMQFEGLAPFKALQAASFRELVRKSYPNLDEFPPLEPAFETFGPRSSMLETPEIQFVTGPIRPRLFFVSEDDSELIQLQHDRLFYNWRRRPGAEIYPRYGHVRDKLTEAFDALSRWAAAEGLGRPKAVQAEAVCPPSAPMAQI